MKTLLAVVGQVLLFAIFLAFFFGGGILGLFHMDPFQSPRWFVGPTGYFVPSGLLLMIIVYVVVLGVEAAARRVRTAGLWTSVAFVAALVVGVLAKFGWVHPS